MLLTIYIAFRDNVISWFTIYCWWFGALEVELALGVYVKDILRIVP